MIHKTQRVGVIDIGSNSVRLVIYDVSGAAMLPYFNEKVMAGLGKGLSDTGRLNEAGIEVAEAALHRFATILDGLEVSQRSVVATAAVRTATDGEAFAIRAGEILGQPIDVLSGQAEAETAAGGVLAGLWQPTGLLGDIGGSSLEFARLEGDRSSQYETHMLGPLAFSGQSYERKARRKKVREVLRQSNALTQSNGGSFYAVGGAWRAVAKLHMELVGYPLRFLNGYRMTASDVEAAAIAAHASDVEGLSQLKSAGGRRAAHLPYTASLLSEVVDMGGFSEVVVSAFGLREGLVRRHFNGITDTGALADGVCLIAQLDPAAAVFGRALHAFVLPALDKEKDLFGDRGGPTRLERAACLLSDIGARFHPDHRAQLSYDLVIRAPLAGLSHADRAYLALAVGARYRRRMRAPEALSFLLDGRQATRARQLGACIRLGIQLSGRSMDILQQARLERTGRELVLRLSPAARRMMSQTVERRLRAAADALELEPTVIAD